MAKYILTTLLILCLSSFLLAETNAKLTKLEIVDSEECIFIGKSIIIGNGNNEAGALWGKCWEDGTFETLEKQKGKLLDGVYSDLTYGVKEDGTFTYMVGMFMKKGALVPKGFTSYKIPVGKMVKACIYGEEAQIHSNAETIINTELKEKGYKADNFMAKVYTCEGFATPKSEGKTLVTIDFCCGVTKSD